MSKNKNQVIKSKELEKIEEDSTYTYEDEKREAYPFKWIDEFTCIDIEDIKRAKVSHGGDGNFIALFYSKTETEPIEVYNKYFEKIEDVRLFIHFILQTYDIDVYDYNYMKEHPEEFD